VETCSRHEKELARIATLQEKFEIQWKSNEATSNRPITFPDEQGEVEGFSIWVRKAVRRHIANGGAIKDRDVVNFSIKPRFEAWRYARMKAYGNHYRI
jgi:hypothetical protein